MIYAKIPWQSSLLNFELYVLHNVHPFEFVLVTHSFIQDYGRPKLDWLISYRDYNRGCYIYGNPILIYLYTLYIYRWYPIRLLVYLRILELQPGSYYREAKLNVKLRKKMSKLASIV